MASEVTDIFSISGSALRAQDQRMKVIAENIANAGTTPATATQKPYQRQIITFKNEFDKALGAYKVKVAGVRSDPSDFIKKYDPAHPAADAQGYVMTPNVNTLVETMDMGEANRAYQANLSVIEAARGMVLHTIQLLQ
ncbi:MAG: flagellar basal body rod protein FlgC [Alphaproteobacteria bacterium]|nr:flagellar basal body rod protein FlgC [Alphaproteobacteria bacterium]